MRGTVRHVNSTQRSGEEFLLFILSSKGELFRSSSTNIVEYVAYLVQSLALTSRLLYPSQQSYSIIPRQSCSRKASGPVHE